MFTNFDNQRQHTALQALLRYMATERTVGVQSDTRESFYGIAPVLRRKSRKDACSAGYISLRAGSLLGDKMGGERGKEGGSSPL